jgi:hypothetical protein
MQISQHFKSITLQILDNNEKAEIVTTTVHGSSSRVSHMIKGALSKMCTIPNLCICWERGDPEVDHLDVLPPVRNMGAMFNEMRTHLPNSSTTIFIQNEHYVQLLPPVTNICRDEDFQCMLATFPNTTISTFQLSIRDRNISLIEGFDAQIQMDKISCIIVFFPGEHPMHQNRLKRFLNTIYNRDQTMTIVGSSCETGCINGEPTGYHVFGVVIGNTNLHFFRVLADYLERGDIVRSLHRQVGFYQNSILPQKQNIIGAIMFNSFYRACCTEARRDGPFILQNTNDPREPLNVLDARIFSHIMARKFGNMIRGCGTYNVLVVTVTCRGKTTIKVPLVVFLVIFEIH